MAKPVSAGSLAKRSLQSHTWLGLVVSAVMFLICLSGTIAVLHKEFERWEQPTSRKQQATLSNRWSAPIPALQSNTMMTPITTILCSLVPASRGW